MEEQKSCKIFTRVGEERKNGEKIIKCQSNHISISNTNNTFFVLYGVINRKNNIINRILHLGF